MSFSQNFSHLLKESKYNDRTLAEKLTSMGKEISKESVGKYRKGERTPDPEFISMVALLLDVTEQDLFDPNKISLITKREINKHKEIYAPLFPELQLKDNMLIIPIINAGAGALAIVEDHIMDTVHIEKRLIPDDKRILIESKNTTLIRVVGDSMEPKINENDVLFIEMLNRRHFVKKDGIYLIRYGDSVQIKHVQFLGNGHANLISANSIYPIVNTKREGVDWEIIGKPFMRWGVEYFSNFEIEWEQCK